MSRVCTRALIALVALAAAAGCRKDNEPPRTDVERGARELAQAAKQTAGALADEAKQVTAKAGDEMAEGARKLSDKAGPLLEELGDKIQRAGERLDDGTADERKSFARETRETLDEVKSWAKHDARPKAEHGARKLKDDIGELADDVERKLDKMQKQAGPAARRTQDEIRDGLEKIRDKLRDAAH
jgi:ElaB/YqjD/DUF883 family membrane-anchored ribosome-binding protein